MGQYSVTQLVDVRSLQRYQLEPLAELVHNAWWEKKKSLGFHSPRECPERENLSGEWEAGDPHRVKLCHKCHTDMYPYDELPEEIKDYDRVTVIAVLEAIEKLQSGQ